MTVKKQGGANKIMPATHKKFQKTETSNDKKNIIYAHKNKLGKFGEQIAKDYLLRKGYTIIQQNLKISYQEIDIVARAGKKTILFEVKTRLNKIYGLAEEALSLKKINNLKKALRLYTKNNFLDLENIYFDFIAVDINSKNHSAKITHYRDIF